jgi:3-dehydroquinate dehydratase-2
MANVLVVHGPNLNLLGERPGDERGRTLDELNGLIHQRAEELGLAVKIYQSNHEGELVNFLQAERRWAESIIINPEALTHTSYVLRECLSALGKPTLEVHLTDIRRRESWRRKSVIKDVCSGQVMGKGFDSYLIALDRIASGDLSGRRKASRAAVEKKVAARKAEPAASPAAALAKAVAADKTIGRRADRSAAPAKSVGRSSAKVEHATEFLSRALVRQRISERLTGKMSPGSLASWARGHWERIQRGGAAETGQREVLEETLQALMLSMVPPSRLTDEQLIDLMAQLEG